MIPGLSERRAALLQRIAADPPVYVRWHGTIVTASSRKIRSHSLMEFVPLRDLLERDYRPETEIGRFLFLRRIRALNRPVCEDPTRARRL